MVDKSIAPSLLTERLPHKIFNRMIFSRLDFCGNFGLEGVNWLMRTKKRCKMQNQNAKCKMARALQDGARNLHCHNNHSNQIYKKAINARQSTNMFLHQ
jgi:hypothetical protein